MAPHCLKIKPRSFVRPFLFCLQPPFTVSYLAFALHPVTLISTTCVTGCSLRGVKSLSWFMLFLSSFYLFPTSPYLLPHLFIDFPQLLSASLLLLSASPILSTSPISLYSLISLSTSSVSLSTFPLLFYSLHCVIHLPLFVIFLAPEVL